MEIKGEQAEISKLAYYEKRAKQMSMVELTYAIKDVKETLVLYKDESVHFPYVEKLLAEFDAYTCEKYKRQKNV